MKMLFNMNFNFTLNGRRFEDNMQENTYCVQKYSSKIGLR